MRVIKYNNKLVYVNLTMKDVKEAERTMRLENNLNKVEIVLNNINGKVFEDEMNAIQRLYNAVLGYGKRNMRIIIYTMNNNLHRICKAALAKRYIIEGGILRLIGGRYSFEIGSYEYCFIKNRWNLKFYTTRRNPYRSAVITFSEDFFNEAVAVIDHYDNNRMRRISKLGNRMHRILELGQNSELYKEMNKSYFDMYPIVSTDIFFRQQRDLYDNYERSVMESYGLKTTERVRLDRIRTDGKLQ